MITPDVSREQQQPPRQGFVYEVGTYSYRAFHFSMSQRPSLQNEEKKAILMELVRIPPPSLASKILGLGYRAAKLTLILWTCHKIYKWIYSP